MGEPQVTAAPAGWRVDAPDFRGLGSAVDDRFSEDTASIDEYAADVEARLDALGVERAVVGGLSMGGYAAFALLRRAAHRVRALILADTRPQADSEDARAGRLKLIEIAKTSGPPAVADQMLPKLLAPANRHGDLEQRVRAIAVQNTSAGLAGALVRMMRRPDSTPLLKDITCPTLIIVGSEDTLTPPDVARDMQRQIPNARLEVIEGAGHLPNLERPEAFNDAVAMFLRSLMP